MSATRTVLLVEDDDGIAVPLLAALAADGYDVRRAEGGEEGLVLATSEGGAEAVVLDLGLPDLDGLEVCRRLRRARPDVAILVLTARASEADVVVGLDAGADDYVTKPFRLAELLARLRALLRRTAAVPDGRELRVQDLRVDRSARRAWRAGEELELTPKEFDLLAALLQRAGSVVTRDELMHDVWDTNWYGSTKTLDMHVSWLRRKLDDDASAPRYLTTVRGVGFRVETEEPAVP